MSISNIIPQMLTTDEMKGVAFNTPPPHLIADAIATVTAQMAQVPKDARGAIVAVGTYGPSGTSVNAAIVVHGPYGIDVQAWIGKTWGSGINSEIRGVKVF